MKFYQIDEVHLVSALCKREGIDTSPTSDVKDNGWRRRKMASENRFGAKSLQLTLGR
jgi:hypothetical protein